MSGKGEKEEKQSEGELQCVSRAQQEHRVEGRTASKLSDKRLAYGLREGEYVGIRPITTISGGV